jgi:hypothetical protein
MKDYGTSLNGEKVKNLAPNLIMSYIRVKNPSKVDLVSSAQSA